MQASEQGKEQGTEHTALGGPCAECDADRGVAADSYCLLPEEVQQPVAKGGVEPQLVQFTYELNSILTYDSVESRWVRAGWRAEQIASSVDRLARYANRKGSRLGGEDGPDV